MLNLNNPPSQPKDTDLDALAGLSTTGLIERTGSGTASTTTVTSYIKTLLDDTNAAAAQWTLGLIPGADVQAYSSQLAEIVSNFSAATNGYAIRKKLDGSGLEYANISGGGGATWGSITGTLSSQTDLNTALGNKQDLDSDLTAVAGLSTTGLIKRTGSGTATTVTSTTFTESLLDDADAATARSTLGLGTIATQASSSVSISGGSITGITDLAVTDGGTGASSASAARTNLGLVIGTDVQAQNAQLSEIATGFAGATNGYFIRKKSDGTGLEYASTSGATDPQFYKLVRVASTANVNISNPGTSTFDNKVLNNGDRILLKNQSSTSDNGIYVFNGSSSAMTRATDFDENTEVKTGTLIFVSEGDTQAAQWWYLSNYNINVGSSAIQFTKIQTSIPTTVAEGGTGATDAATALVNLGYYTTTPIKQACRVASTTNVTISNPGTSTFDGVSISTNDRVLLTGQTSTTENGIYVFNGSSVAMTRSTDADTTGEIFYGMIVGVVAGSSNPGIWQCTTAGTPSIGANAIAFSKITTGGGGSGTVTSVAVTAPSIFSVTGSPVTTSGTIDLALATQTTNKVFASPNGSTGTPTFRALVAADIPDLSATYQPLDGDLTSIAALTTTTFGRSLLTQADASATRTTIGTVIGTDVQAQSARLQDIAANLSATSGTVEKTAANTFGTYTVTAFAKTFLDDTTQSAVQTTLGVLPGTDVQAYSARLADITSGFAGASTLQVLRKNAAGTALEYATISSGGSSPNAISFSNADRTITSGECTGDSLVVRQTGTISAVRTLTLPAAGSVSAGYTIDVVDETGSPSWWFPINITPAGSDTIGGLGSSFPLQLNLPYQAIKLISNGSNAWTFRKYDPGLQDYILIDQDAINTTPVSGQTQAFGMSTIAASGAGAASGNVGQTSGSDFPAISVNSGTTSSGLSQFSTNGIIRFGAKIHRFCIRGRIPVLPDATNDFVSWVGIGNDLQQASPNFVTFAFNYDRSTGFWRTSTIKSFAQRTFTTTSVAGDTNMHTFAGEMNAAGTSAKFYIDGVLVATHTTNIETSGGGAKFGFGGAKSAGTTDRAFFEANKMQLLVYDPANRRSSI